MLILLDIKHPANGSSEGVIGIVKSVLAERQWEHADVLEVEHPNAMVCVDKDVVLLDVRVVNHTRRRLEQTGDGLGFGGREIAL